MKDGLTTCLLLFIFSLDLVEVAAEKNTSTAEKRVPVLIRILKSFHISKDHSILHVQFVFLT